MVASAPIGAAEYSLLVADVRAFVESATHPGSIVLVASKGDDSLVSLPGRQGWHFPRDVDGRYAGYYPADSEAAILHVEQLREQGAEYLVLPSTAFWWLEHYQGLADHLQRCYPATEATPPSFSPGIARQDDADEPAVSPFAAQLRSYLGSLLPAEAVVAVVSTGDPTLVALERVAWHFPRGPSGECGRSP